MSETKIQHITTSHGDTFEITDRDGNHVTLSPEEAVLVLQFLYGRVDELTRLVNGLEASEQAANPYQLSNGFLEAVTGEDGPQKVPLYDDDDIPEFTEQEALLLCNALNGVRCTPGTLTGNIAAAPFHGYDGDRTAFLTRIDALTEVQAQAVIDAVELFWREPYQRGAEVYASLYEVGLVKRDGRHE